MRIYFIYFLFLLAIIGFSSCKKSPDLNECIKYNGDENACKSHGCSFEHSAFKTINQDGSCLGWNTIKCLPIDKNDSCESVENMYCHNNSDGTKEILITGYSCNYNLGHNWYNCNYLNYQESFNCFQKQEVCSSQTDELSCINNYCAWISKGYKAILEDGQCTGWNPAPISGCYSLNAHNSGENGFLWRTFSTQDGTAIIKPITFSQTAITFSEDPSQIYCYEWDPNLPEICNCPDPPE